jgi:hypothetical protein
MVTINYQPALLAHEGANRQRHLLSVTAAAAILRSVARILSFYRAASVRSFARQDAKEWSPCHIIDGLGEMVMADHPANVQVFDRDPVKAGDQFLSLLVMKIFAAARHFKMAQRESAAAPSSGFDCLSSWRSVGVAPASVSFQLVSDGAGCQSSRPC